MFRHERDGHEGNLSGRMRKLIVIAHDIYVRNLIVSGALSGLILEDAGHCAFKYQSHWAPATFEWLAEKLAR